MEKRSWNIEAINYVYRQSHTLFMNTPTTPSNPEAVSKSAIRFLRGITLLEGISLILLVCIAVPIKYLGEDESYVKLLGPIHGFLFILFCYSAWTVGSKLNWNWRHMMGKLLLASFIPFGTFYLDHKVLRHLGK